MLGVTVENGKVVEWLKSEGESVEKGEAIFVVEADKVTTEVESPASGILAKIMLPPGEEVPVLSVIGIIIEPGEEVPAKYMQEDVPLADTAAAAGDLSEPQTTQGNNDAELFGWSQESAIIKAVPAARKLAKDKGVDLRQVPPTGPNGIITHRDVAAAESRFQMNHTAKVSTLARRKAEAEGVSLEGLQGSGVRGRRMCVDVEGLTAIAATAPSVQQSAADVDSNFGSVIKMDSMRQAIARRLSSSAFTAPHVAFYTDIHMDPLLSYRKEILPYFEQTYKLRPSINDFLIKAVALTIREFPMLNAMLQGSEIHIKLRVNIGLAVSVSNGLVVPAITDADQHGLSQIALQRSDLTKRALAGQLTMEEMERGTFTISSLAQSDVIFFTSILNPPQSGILSVGKTREELALVDGDVVTKQVSTMGLTVDHRIIDGAMAAKFVETLKAKLETPAFTFMHS